MKLRNLFTLIVLTMLAVPMCQAGSIKGKVAPGKSVVYLESASGTVTPVAGKKLTIDQRGLLFQPHVLVIQAGTTVEFLNSDNVAHNVIWPHGSGNKRKSHNQGTSPTGDKQPF